VKIKIVSTEAELTNANLKTEGNKAAPVSRTDLNFEMICDGYVIKALSGCEDVGVFWKDDGFVSLLGIEVISSKCVLKDCRMKFGDPDAGAVLEVVRVKVKSISFKPINGSQVRVWLQAQVHHSPEQLVIIDSLQHKTAPISIETEYEDQLELYE
jgi:hypothetical protein